MLRSLIFNIFLYYYLFYISIKYRFISKTKYQKFIKNFSYISYRVLKFTIGLDYKIKHPEKKKNYPVIYAVKHESAWETLILIDILSPCVFVLKKELTKIPFFGGLLKAVGMIPIERGNMIKSVRQIIKGTKQATANGNSVIIFPEGTRAKPGILNELQSGVYAPYSANKLTVVPVFIDSGKFWPRKGFLKKPGTIKVEFLEEIKPGLNKDDFMEKLNSIFINKMQEEKGI